MLLINVSTSKYLSTHSKIRLTSAVSYVFILILFPPPRYPKSGIFNINNVYLATEQTVDIYFFGATKSTCTLLRLVNSVIPYNDPSLPIPLSLYPPHGRSRSLPPLIFRLSTSCVVPLLVLLKNPKRGTSPKRGVQNTIDLRYLSFPNPVGIAVSSDTL